MVAMVTGHNTASDREGKGRVTGGSFLWRANIAVTRGGQGKVMTFTGQAHIT